jgi:hypothetical protein
MANYNVPGLNERMMREVMRSSPRASQVPTGSSSDALAQQEYEDKQRKLGPILQKTAIPSSLLYTMAEPNIRDALIGNIGKVAPSVASRLSPIADTFGGPVGALAYAASRTPGEILKSNRMAAQKNLRAKAGVPGYLSDALGMFSSANYITSSVPRMLSMFGAGALPMLGKAAGSVPIIGGSLDKMLSGAGGIAGEIVKNKSIPRLETLMAKSGVLPGMYSGVKKAGDFLTGGKISDIISASADKEGLLGAASKGAGLLDSGIESLLTSPTGIMTGMAGLSVGAAIWKSVKLARLTPTRQSPDNLGRKIYGQDPSVAIMQKISAMASTGKIDPQTLSFMVLQVIEGDIRRTNMFLAGIRGQLISDQDFLRQEKEKGEAGFSETYGKEILGEDNEGILDKIFNKVAFTITDIKNKYDPVTQIINKLLGRSVNDTSGILAKSYGYDTETEMVKERAESFGTALDQTKLLHTPSTGISSMASTFESKQLALASALVDINRYMLAELMTIRLSAFGIEQNILYKKEPGVFRKFLTSIVDKINPANWPGFNALMNLAKVPFSILKGFRKAGEYTADIYRGAVGKVRDVVVGKHYQELKEPQALMEEAGLYKGQEEKVSGFISNGLPGILAEIRWAEFERINIQSEILNIQQQMLEVIGGQYQKTPPVIEGNDLLVWDDIESKYLVAPNAEKLRKSREMKMLSIKEKAFSQGFYGKFSFLKDVVKAFKTPKISEKRAEESEKEYNDRQLEYTSQQEQPTNIIEYLQNIIAKPTLQYLENKKYQAKTLPGKLAETVGFQAGVKRMTQAEERAGQIEQKYLGGQQETFLTKDIVNALSREFTSLKTRTGIEATSEEVEDIKRKLEFKPLEEGIAKTLAQLSPIIGALLGGPVGAGILGGVGVGEYSLWKLFQKGKVSKAAIESIGYRTPEEEIIERYRDMPREGLSQQDIINTLLGIKKETPGPPEEPTPSPTIGGIKLGPPSQRLKDQFGFQSRMLDELINIRNYLGVSETDNIYTLLAPIKPPIAEVTLVTKSGNPIPEEPPGKTPAAGKVSLPQETSELSVISKIFPDNKEVEIPEVSKIIPISKHPKFKDSSEPEKTPPSAISQILSDAADDRTITLANVSSPQETSETSAIGRILSDAADDRTITLDNVSSTQETSAIGRILSNAAADDYTADTGKKEAAAGGGFREKNIPALVGEMGPEIFIPSTAGNVIPTDIFNRIYDVIEDIRLTVQDAIKEKVASDKNILPNVVKVVQNNTSEILKEKESNTAETMSSLIHDAQTVSAQESQQSTIILKELFSSVVELNQQLSESSKIDTIHERIQDIRKKEKEKEDQQLTTQLTENIGALAGKIENLKLAENEKPVEDNSLLSKILTGIGIAGSLLVLFNIVKDLLLNNETTGPIIKKISKFAQDQIFSFFSSPGLSVPVLALTGATVGIPFGIPGILIGGFVGAVMGSVGSWITNLIKNDKEKGLLDTITSTLLGTKEGGLMSALQTMGPWALAGGLAGGLFLPVVGHLTGALLGAVLGATIGGVVGWLGQDKIKDLYINKFGGMLQDANDSVINNLLADSAGESKYHLSLGRKWAHDGAAVFPVLGPVLGYALGSIIDLITMPFVAGHALGEMLDVWINNKSVDIINGYKPGSTARDTAALFYNAFPIPILGPLIGGVLGTIIDFFSNLFNADGLLNSLKSFAKDQLPDWAIKLLFTEPKKIKTENINYSKFGISQEQFSKLPLSAKNTLTTISEKIEKVEVELNELEENKSNISKTEYVSKKKSLEELLVKQQKLFNNVKSANIEKSPAAIVAAEVKSKPPEPKALTTQTLPTNAAVSAEIKPPVFSAESKPPEPKALTTQTIPTHAPPKEVESSEIKPINFSSGSIGEVLKTASEQTKAPLDIMAPIAWAESKFDPYVKATGSSASGLFQFIKSTWKDLTSRKGGKYGITPETSPFDPMANALMGGEYINESISAIGSQKLGDVYTAHVLGTGGAKKLFRTLEINPFEPAYRIFPKEAASNQSIFYDKSKKPRNVTQVYSELSSRVGQPPDMERLNASIGEDPNKFKNMVGSFKDSLDTLAIKSPVFDAFYDFSKKIGDEFVKAFNFKFDDRGINQPINVEQAREEIKPIEDDTSAKEPIKDTRPARLSERNRSKSSPQNLQIVKQPTSIPVQRNDLGTEISPNFTKLEREIFNSLDVLFVNSVTRYPFESQMNHSY